MLDSKRSKKKGSDRRRKERDRRWIRTNKCRS